MDLATRLRRELAEGKSPDLIVSELVAGGMTESTARRLVDRAITQPDPPSPAGSLADSRFLYSLPPRPVTGVVSVDPFFAKIIASSCAGSVWLGLPDSSCTAPGGSKNISPAL